MLRAPFWRRGFRDNTARYLTEHLWSGVWLSDVPLDANEGAKGYTLPEVTLPDGHGIDFDEYEQIEERKPYREWLMPSSIVNPCMSVCIVDEDEAAT